MRSHRVKLILELAAVVLVAVVPPMLFWDKAFHVDDYSYLRAARQILKDPLRPYEFAINWRGASEPAWQMMNKPPLIPYYLALGVRLFGENERPLHATFLIFPAIAGVALYLLARRYTGNPLWPTLLFLACPAALVGSTNLMLDNPSFALYLAAIAVWLWAAERAGGAGFVAAAALIGIATWANYLCLSLLPLLGAYQIARERGLSRRLLYLLIPAGIFGLWCLQSWWAHGRADVLVALGHHAGEGEMPYFYPALVAVLTFTGGCVLPLVLLSPLTTRGWRQWMMAAGGALAVAAVLALASPSLTPSLYPTPPLGVVLGAVFAFGSVSLFYGAGRYAWEGFSAERLLLVLWLGGFAVFLLFINWTVAARFVLFLAPPALLIAQQQLEKTVHRAGWRHAACAVAFGVSLPVSTGLAAADRRWANEQRERAYQIRSIVAATARKGYFRCHWGLQYYLERGGLEAFDEGRESVETGSIIVVAAISAAQPIPAGLRDHVSLIRMILYEPGLTMQLQNPRCGAGFYTHKYGPVPYTVSATRQEQYDLYIVSP